ncbi:MAG: MOSC domain-containing protein [Roseovarius sp.]|nr:MOSC domain-containing protein [Roseovarius sp.]
MQALRPTDHAGRVVWLGRVSDRAAGLEAEALAEADLTFGGIAGEAHGGRTRPSCSRVLEQHPRGTEIANVRQLSVLSAEELAAIARDMGGGALDPGWLGASLVIEGIPDFSHVPPSSRLQAPSGATLVIDMENRACQLPARVIEAHWPGRGKGFMGAAGGRRGVTAWVEREGRIARGDVLRLHVPDQPPWAGGQARGRG